MPGGLFAIKPRPVLVSSTPAVPTVSLFLQSDPHFGAADVDYELLEQERSQVLLHRSRLCVNGDIFDAILTRDAKRYEPTKLHKRLQGRNDILNASIEMAYEYYAPVARQIDFIGTGNHDTAVAKLHNFDPVAALVARLNTIPGAHISYGGYAGLVNYTFRFATSSAEDSLGRFVLFYWHGSGGGTSLSSSASEFDKKAFVEGADAVWFGHKHTRLAVETERIVCHNRSEIPTLRRQWNIRTGSYFRTYEAQKPEDVLVEGRQSNFAADALLQPHGRGGVRVVLVFDRAASRLKLTRVELDSFA